MLLKSCLIDVTLYLQHVHNLVFNVLMKNERKTSIVETGGYRVDGYT